MTRNHVSNEISAQRPEVRKAICLMKWPTIRSARGDIGRHTRAHSGKGAEERDPGPSPVAQKNAAVGCMVSVIIGEVDQAALPVFATANRVAMLEHSVFCITSCASILKERKNARGGKHYA